MKRTRNFYVGVTIVAVIAVLTIAQFVLQTVASAQSGGVQAGVYEVDRAWPKPLPNNWILGSTVGLGIDSRDHIFVTHRGQPSIDPKFGAMMAYAPPAGRGGNGEAPAPVAISIICCAAAPPILEFDPEGNLVNHWGGPGAGYEWPKSMHGLTVDGKGNIWLPGNAGNTLLKFSRDGKFLLQIGKNGASKGNADTANLSNPAEVDIDEAANEAFVADGYGNRRVIVYDTEKGTFKRMWGAYGKPPVDLTPGPYDPNAPMPNFFRLVHCATLANDGLVYVCDRQHNRIQVFRRDGTFVKETQVAKRTFGDGAPFDLAFSKDNQQRLMYMADGANHRIWQMLREPLQVLNHIGTGGRQPGQFYAPHNVMLDSKGNIYTVETYSGARLQKHIYKGMAAVTKPEGNHN
jgi:hypothetical protein